MIALIEMMLLITVLSAVSLPVVLLTLARFGYFEPIEFDLFGRPWSFARRQHKVVGFSNATWSAFPVRQYAYAGVVTVALTIAASGASTVTASGISGTRATTAVITRD